MSEEQLQQIEARLKAATPGPWVPTEPGSWLIRPADQHPAVAQAVIRFYPGRGALEAQAVSEAFIAHRR